MPETHDDTPPLPDGWSVLLGKMTGGKLLWTVYAPNRVPVARSEQGEEDAVQRAQREVNANWWRK